MCSFNLHCILTHTTMTLRIIGIIRIRTAYHLGNIFIELLILLHVIFKMNMTYCLQLYKNVSVVAFVWKNGGNI